MSNDAAADDRLGRVAMNLMKHGLQVKLPLDPPSSPDDPDAGSIVARNPASGERAKVGYVTSADDSGKILLELTYRTDPDHDPDGAHLASRVIRLLSTAPMPDRM